MKFKEGDKVRMIRFMRFNDNTQSFDEVPDREIEEPWKTIIKSETKLTIKSVDTRCPEIPTRASHAFPYQVEAYNEYEDEIATAGFCHLELELYTIKDWQSRID